MNNCVTIKCMGLVAKFRIRDEEEYIQKTIRETNSFYEYDMLLDMWGRLFPDDLVVDIGANIGNHTVFIAKIAKTNVIAFEPFSRNYEHLLENIQLNNLQSKVTSYEMALSSGTWNAETKELDPKNCGKIKVIRNKAGATRVHSLDSVLDVPNVRMIKIDVEGSELSVLRGASRTINKFKPLIYVECETSLKFKAVRQYLANLNYSPIRRFNFTPTYLFVHQRSPEDL